MLTGDAFVKIKNAFVKDKTCFTKKMVIAIFSKIPIT